MDHLHDESEFSALLVPHRSLSPRGFVIIMIFVVSVSFVAGVVFSWLGAWPVFGFFGLDVVLIYWAFKHSFKVSERREMVEVTEHEVVLRRFFPAHPVEELRFVRRWVRVNLEEDFDRELVGALNLCCARKRYEIGGFLSPDDRKSFAYALKFALAQPHI